MIFEKYSDKDFSFTDCTSFAVPECGDEIQEISDVIKSGWHTTASRCAKFESDFAGFVCAKHALAVNS